MKKVLLVCLILGICASLSAQESELRHSLSLNFNGGFPQRFRTLMPQEILRKWVPGLEYRFSLNERVQLRAGIVYKLPQTFIIGNPSTGFLSRTSSQSGGATLGGQVHFWPTSYLQNFQAYALGEFEIGSINQKREVLNRVSNPQEQKDESIYRYAGVNLGLGLAYWFGQKWVFRFESAYRFNWYARELISGVDLQAPQTPVVVEGDIIRFFSHGLLPISEVSIGWRF